MPSSPSLFSAPTRCFVAVLLVALSAAPLAAQVRFQVRDDKGSLNQPFAVGLNQTISPTVFITNSGGSAPSIQGFQMAVTHDPAVLDFQSGTWKGTALDTPSLRNSQGPEFFGLREATGAGPQGFTLGVVFEQQAQTFVLGEGDSKVLVLSFKALQLTAEGQSTRIEFAPQLGNPAVSNLYDERAGGQTLPPDGLDGLAVTVGAEPSYQIGFRDPAATINTGAEFTVPIMLHNSPKAIDGFSFGVKHVDADLDLLDVTLAEGITTVLGGNPDDRFFALNRAPAGGAGFTVALILSQSDRTKVFAAAASPHHILNARYRLKRASGSTDLDVSGDLGLPKVEVILDIFGVTQRPLLPSANPAPVKLTVTAQGTGTEQRFTRGDVDQNGRITLTDPIGLLSYLFQGEQLASNIRATADNCLVAFNIDGDVDGTGTETESQINITDVIYFLGYQFQDGPPPAAPFQNFGRACGTYTGKTSDRMTCRQFSCPP